MEQQESEAANPNDTDSGEDVGADAAVAESPSELDTEVEAEPAAQAEADAENSEAPEAAPAAAPAGAPKKRVPPKPPGSGAFEAEMGLVLAQLYAEYDFEVVDEAAPAGRVLDLWALPDGKKVPAPAAPASKTKTASFKEKWPPRGDHAAKREFRLYAFLSKTKDPGWSVPGKEVLAISADAKSGLLLLMADQRGYFLPSNRVRDLCDLFTPVAASPFKVTGPKLRKAAIARFFSLAGFGRELAAARHA